MAEERERSVQLEIRPSRLIEPKQSVQIEGKPEKDKKKSVMLSSSVTALRNENKNKPKSRRRESRVRIKLPVIESYQKEFEYAADAPGRVVVRLERLMGTDRIRVTDQKYMNTLFKQLEADEQELWLKRSKQRKQSEKNRFRQLAIEGYMDPGPDMQDLYNHPVFRVNRILNRLARLDNAINILPSAPLPPITPVEPFEEYKKTGILFPFHPDHYRRTGSTTAYLADNEVTTEEELLPPVVPRTAVSLFEEATDQEFLRKYEKESGMITSTSTTDFEQSEEWGGEGYAYAGTDETSLPATGCNPDKIGFAPLSQVKRFFGISGDERTEHSFEPHRSALVEAIYNEETGGANEIYSSAKDVIDTYQREQLKADNVVNKLHRV